MAQNRDFMFTRRGALLTLGAGFAAVTPRLFAFSGNFWEKKEPSEWSSDEIHQLATKSPWAKEVSGQVAGGGGGGGYGNGGGGGGGYGGMGRGGGGGGRNRPAAVQNFKGTIRWETAKPIREALKDTIPPAFDGHYVIAVAGIPLNEYGSRRSQGSTSDDQAQDMLDHLKGVTLLQPKDKRDIQPGVVQKGVSGDLSAVFFGFSKEALTLSPDDKEAGFITQFGRLELKTKFNLKDMVYRGELAV